MIRLVGCEINSAFGRFSCERIRENSRHANSVDASDYCSAFLNGLGTG